MCRHLCCCCFWFGKGHSPDSGQHIPPKKRTKEPKNKELNDSKEGDSEKYLKSSTETDLDRIRTKNADNTVIPSKPSKIEIRFESPTDARDDSIASHRIRLKERGFELTDDKPIGEGTFSKVYSVIRLSDNKLMACKVKMNREIGDSTALTRRLSDEIQRLILNPYSFSIHLIRYFAQFVYDSKYSYIVMELTKKESLEKRLANSKGPFSESIAKSYFIPIARALNYLHTKRVPHRNLKLDNILFLELPKGKEILKVSDYCMNRVATKPEKVVVYLRDAKSITYMSPQILKFYAKNLRKIYKKTEKKRINFFDPFCGDIWALGVCLYYMLMKTAPYGLPPDTRTSDETIAPKERFKYLEQCLAKFQNKLDLNKSVSNELTKECINILLNLLEPKSNRRIEHFGVIQHNWIFLDTNG